MTVHVRVLLPALALLSGLTPPMRAQAAQPEAIFLVRHAEKVDESKDAALSARGEARAAALAKTLESAGVKAIFATEYQRTQATAAPLAQLLGLRTEVLPANDPAGLLKAIARHPGEVVLVVGHSDTLPEIIAALGVSRKVTIARDQYDDLFVVVPNGSAHPSFLDLHYGPEGVPRKQGH